MCRCSFRPTVIQRTEEADPPSGFLHLEATAHIASLVFRPLTLRAFFSQKILGGKGRIYCYIRLIPLKQGVTKTIQLLIQQAKRRFM